MDAEYLKENVGDVLSEGLANLVMHDPPDKVDYLAKWLLKYVDNKNKENAAKVTLDSLIAEDLKKEESAAKVEAEAASVAKAAANDASKRIQDFENYLTQPSSGIMDFFEGFIKHLSLVSGVKNIYIGLKTEGGSAAAEEEEEGGEPAPSGQLKYIAASSGQEFMLKKKLTGKGITHRVFAPRPEPEAAEEEEDGEAKPAEVVEQEDESVFISNVLLDENTNKIHFFRSGNTGSYFAMHLPHEGCLNEATLTAAKEQEATILEEKAAADEEAAAAAAAAAAEAAAAAAAEAEAEAEAAAAAEEGEGDPAEGEGDSAVKAEEEAAENQAAEETGEEKAEREAKEAKEKADANEAYLCSRLPKEKRDYVVCMDTTDTNERMTEEQVATIKKFVTKFKESLTRMDRTLFKEERLKRATFAEIEEGAEEVNDNVIAAEKAKIAAALEKEGLPNTDADVQFNYRQNLVATETASMIQEFSSEHVFRGPIEVLLALFYLLDYDRDALCDSDNVPDWNRMRRNLNESFFVKIKGYDARKTVSQPKDKRYKSLKSIMSMVKDADVDAIKKVNLALAEIVKFVREAIAVKKQVRDEKIQAQKEAEEAAAAAAAAAAEKEAAEKAAAEAAAAEAAANEAEAGEGDNAAAVEEEPAE